MHERIPLSHRRLELVDIRAHHSDTETALRVYYDLSGKGVSLTARFAAYTQNELRSELNERIHELEATSSFTLLAFLEAIFMIDYLARCYGKKKDELSRTFREIYKKKGNRPSLADDVLETWKRHHLELKPLISELIGAFNYRHWLAHGRYWVPKLSSKYDYFGIYSLAVILNERMPLFRQ